MIPCLHRTVRGLQFRRSSRPAMMHSMMERKEAEPLLQDSSPRPSVRSPSSGLSKHSESAAAQSSTHQRESAISVPANGEDAPVHINYLGSAQQGEGTGVALLSHIKSLWSNLPHHIRDSMHAPSKVSEASLTLAGPLGTALDRMKFQMGLKTLDPDLPDRYGSTGLVIEPYVRGQTAAYNWPNRLVPRSVAARWPLDMYVDPVYFPTDTSRDMMLKSKPITLFSRLQGRVSLLLLFSGQPMAGLCTGVQAWTDSIGDVFSGGDVQILKVHFHEGWLSRRTHVLTKSILRGQLSSESEQLSTFVYRGRWPGLETVVDLHLYNKDLPTVLMLDRKGYIRWHAVGLPSEKAVYYARDLGRKLRFEK